jgi:hypothetical protein
MRRQDIKLKIKSPAFDITLAIRLESHKLRGSQKAVEHKNQVKAPIAE